MSTKRRFGSALGLCLIVLLLGGCVEITESMLALPTIDAAQMAQAPAVTSDAYTSADQSAALAYLTEGQALKERGDLDEAIRAYTMAIERDPAFAEAYYHRGRVWQDLRDLKAAIEDYNRALDLDPRLAMAFEDRALVREELGDVPGAMADYDRAIELNPESGRTYTNRAVARRKLGDVSGAIADHTRAIELLPDSPQKAIPFFNRGNARQAQGDLAGAIADFTRAIELDPMFAAAYTNRAGLLETKDLQAAISDYGRALELPSDDEDAHTIALGRRGFIYLRSNNISAAARDFGRAIELNPDYACAYVGLGYVALTRGGLSLAIGHFDHAIRLAPELADAYLGRAAAHEANSRMDLAFDDMMRGLALLADDKSKVVGYIKLGVVFAAMGDHKRATLAWTSALELEPTGKLYTDRGTAFVEIGAYDRAIDDFRAATKLDPNNAVAHFNLARVLLRHLDTNYEEALEHAQRAVELTPHAVQHDTLALAYHRIGQLQKALEHLGVALQLNPLQVESYKHRGDVYRELGNRSAALADYQLYLKLAPQAADRGEVETLVRSLLEHR